MSGEKCHTYRVEYPTYQGYSMADQQESARQAAERAAHERVRARAVEDVRQLRGAYEALLEECHRRVNLFGEVFDPGVALPAQAGHGDVNVLEREALQIREVIVELRSRVEEKVSSVRDEFVQRAVAGGFGGSAVRSGGSLGKRLEEHRREVGEREAAAAGWREDLLATVGRVASAERIPFEVTEEDLGRIRSAVELALAADTKGKADIALVSLRGVLDEVRESCDRRRERGRLRASRLETVELLRLEVAGVDSPLADRVVRLLDEAESDPDRPLPPTLEALVEEAVRSHEAALAAVYVRDALVDVFDELGLEVLDGFEIEFAEAQSLVFKRPGWDRHAVVASVSEGEGRFQLNLIREAQVEGAGVDTLSRNYEEELETDVMPKLEAALADRGVQLGELTGKTIDGGYVVPEVAEGTLSKDATNDDDVKGTKQMVGESEVSADGHN